MDRAGETMRRQPFDERAGIEERAIDALGGRLEDTVQTDGSGHDVISFESSSADATKCVVHCLSTNGRRRNRHRSEEHTSELQSLMRISYAVFCLKKKTTEE